MKKLGLIFVMMTVFVVLTSGKALSDVTYKVRSGDSLYKISKKYRVPVDGLKRLNGLTSIKLKLGQTIVVKKDAEIPKKKSVDKPAETAITENDEEFIQYRTRRGDTLDKLALKFNVDKDDIATANNFTEKAGKKLPSGKIILIPKVVEEPDEDFVSLTNKPLNDWKTSDEKYMLVKVAKSFMGAPYKYGGESVRGLDCSAFVKKIYEIFDVQLPRSAREQFRVGARIEKEELSVGDLVFFRTQRYAKYPTHVGIYIGDGNFIHSSSSHCKDGVKIDGLASEFYSKAYIGAVRVKRTPDENADVSKTSEMHPGKS